MYIYLYDYILLHTYIHTEIAPQRGTHKEPANERLMGQKQDELKDQKPESSVDGARDKIIIHIGSRPTACRFTRQDGNNLKQTHQTQKEGSAESGVGPSPRP
jgi:hypothetical protein